MSDLNDKDLKPCPFCGSKANLEDHRLVWIVRCSSCDGYAIGERAPEPHGDGESSDDIQDAQSKEMADNTDWDYYEKTAIDAWNNRLPKPFVQVVKTEKLCTHPEGCTYCSWCGFRSADYDKEKDVAEKTAEYLHARLNPDSKWHKCPEEIKDRFRDLAVEGFGPMKKDAERYRFLRENPNFQIEYTGEKTLDQHIDAEMQWKDNNK